MYPLPHFILNIIPSILIILAYGWIGIFFWVGAFFVDFDHYLWYILKFKNFSLKKAYIYGKDINHEDSFLHIFHTVEFWILIGVWAIYSEVIFTIVLGLAYHMTIDFIWVIYRKLFFARNLSFFMWLKDYSPSNYTKLKTK